MLLQRFVQFGTTGFSTDAVVTVDAFTAGGFQFPDLHLCVLDRGAHSGVAKTRHESPPITSYQRRDFPDVGNIRVRHIGGA